MTPKEKDFTSMQIALYVTLAFELMGALFFLWTTCFVVEDKRKVDEAEKMAAQSGTGGGGGK